MSEEASEYSFHSSNPKSHVELLDIQSVHTTANGLEPSEHCLAGVLDSHVSHSIILRKILCILTHYERKNIVMYIYGARPPLIGSPVSPTMFVKSCKRLSAPTRPPKVDGAPLMVVLVGSAPCDFRGSAPPSITGTSPDSGTPAASRTDFSQSLSCDRRRTMSFPSFEPHDGLLPSGVTAPPSFS